MEDEIIVPALVSVYKAEVWRHLGFCGNVCPGITSVPPLAASRVKSLHTGAAGGRVAARLQLSLVSGAFCAVRAVLVSRSRRFHAEHKYKPKNL